MNFEDTDTQLVNCFFDDLVVAEKENINASNRSPRRPIILYNGGQVANECREVSFTKIFQGMYP